MKICSYVMKHDTGFAPNPFYGYCTLATCTPNHMNANLNEGDYIAGYFTDQSNPYLVYWLKVYEVLDFQEYFHDPRFKRKKPKLDGNQISKCGDNIYQHNNRGKWIQENTLYHKDTKSMEQDIRYHVVYIGREFSYFGEKAYSKGNCVHDDFRDAIKKGRGIKYTREDHPHFRKYLRWLNAKPLGRHGRPRDIGSLTSCVKC